jgi:hypothetical protein
LTFFVNHRTLFIGQNPRILQGDVGLKRKYKISLGILSTVGALWGAYAVLPWIKAPSLSPSEAAAVAAGGPQARARVTAQGALLSMQDPDREIARAKSRQLRRSPAFESDATRELDFTKLSRDFLTRNRLESEHDKLTEFFPNGKGVNQAIRFSILLSSRAAEGEDAFFEISLANRVQAEIYANPESSVVSLDQGLAKLPREFGKERFAAIRLLSNLAIENPTVRDEVKTALLAEAQRSPTQADGALVFAALLRMNSSKDWFQEVNRSFEKFHPGAELSDFVAVNVVAL